MTRVAAIDLGTHNCRLIIAERLGDGFRTIRVQSVIVRLGEGAAKGDELQPEAIERTVAALKRFAEIIWEEAADEVYAVATEACRMASNRKEFVARIKAECGLEFVIIPPHEEVRLSVLATYPLIGAKRRQVMTLDIGGGSTELVLLEKNGETLTALNWKSLPLGVVRGRDQMKHAEVMPDEFQDMIHQCAGAMKDFFSANADFFKDPPQVIGSSATVTTLAALWLNLERYQRERIDGLECRVSDLVDLALKTALEPLAVRRANPLIGPERAEFMAPGCAIFMAIFSHLKAETMTAADRGLREGILNGLLPGAPEVMFASAEAA